VSGAEQRGDDRWTLGLRAVDGQIDRAAFRSTLTYRPFDPLTLGIEYNPLASKVSPLANWLAVAETDRSPAIMFGTSSDRIGTSHGQSFYVTTSKSLRRWTRLPIAPYAGASFGTYDDRLRPIGGVNIALSSSVDVLVIFDGVHVHPTASWTKGRHVFSMLLVEGRHLGVGYSVSFRTPGF
jgi:hypothetical protein